VVGLDGDALRAERAWSVGGTERVVRHPYFVEAGCHEDVIEHARLAFESPEGAALDEVRRDGLEFGPAGETAVGLEHSVKQIAHGASVALRPSGSLASSDYVAAAVPVCLWATGAPAPPSATLSPRSD